jgi:hypothetical protein
VLKFTQHGEAFEPTPRIAEPDEPERVEESLCVVFLRLEHETEKSGGPSKIAPPDCMAGILGQRRVEHARYFRPSLQPPCHLQGAPLVPLQPNPHRPQSAQREPNLLGAGLDAKVPVQPLQRWP